MTSGALFAAGTPDVHKLSTGGKNATHDKFARPSLAPSQEPLATWRTYFPGITAALASSFAGKGIEPNKALRPRDSEEVCNRLKFHGADVIGGATSITTKVTRPKPAIQWYGAVLRPTAIMEPTGATD